MKRPSLGLHSLRRHSADVRAMRQLTDELRDREPAAPVVDEKKALSALWERIDRDPPLVASTPLRLRSAPAIGVAALAIAAAAGLYLARSGSTPSRTDAARTTLLASEPTRYVAGNKPLRAERGGLASWVVEPRGALTLVEDGERIVVALDEGAVQVDVLPQSRPERFVVLVGNVRVAVHGTHFRVARVDGRVEVDVAQGIVRVGSVSVPGDPSSTWLVRAPSGGSFPLSDVRDGHLRALEPFDASPVASASTSPPSLHHESVRQHVPPKASVQMSPQLGAEPLHDALQRAALGCFARLARPADGVRLSVLTTLVVEIQAEGRFESSAFDPPLAPTIEACFRQEAAALHGPAGTYTISMELAAP